MRGDPDFEELDDSDLEERDDSDLLDGLGVITLMPSSFGFAFF